ncbi:LacI family DNA-binding transcriptional regulator [Actinoplanes sp. NPDC051470]|uniref:LacI family DNA-binding transcriptional regulator n=1 Tax=unclassified Actinoplanes TaxID=2626549 RepID=UPI003441A359
MASRGPSVRDIAAATGVSIATVSRVMNGHPNVADQTRDLVRRAYERRGAALPRPAPGHPVLVRCPYVLTDYFGAIVSSIAERLNSCLLDCLLDAGESAQAKSVLPGLPSRRDVSGALLILPPESGDELIALRRSGFPFVVIDPRTAPPPDIAAVSAAHTAGARALTSHLVELGHRRIGVIGGPDEWLAGSARRDGHTAALARAGMIADPALLCSAHATTEDGYRAALRLLTRSDRPTALIGFNDKVAVGILSAAWSLGLNVPGDLSVAGFDDIDLSRAVRPALTTVRQPLSELGRIAVDILMRLIAGHEVHALHVELAVELIIRDSTAAAPRA